jgi:hypothetical protein
MAAPLPMSPRAPRRLVTVSAPVRLRLTASGRRRCALRQALRALAAWAALLACAWLLA